MGTKKKKKHAGGRPVTVGATEQVTLRLERETLATWEKLAAKDECTKTDVLRRLLREARP